jgi:hypothetical protein
MTDQQVPKPRAGNESGHRHQPSLRTAPSPLAT